MDLIHSLFYEQTGLQRESQIQIMSLSDGFYVLFTGMAKKIVKFLCIMTVPRWPNIKKNHLKKFPETIWNCFCPAANIIIGKLANISLDERTA